MPITTWNDDAATAPFTVAQLYPLGTRRYSNDQTTQYEYVRAIAAGFAVGELLTADVTVTTGGVLKKTSAVAQKHRGIAHVTGTGNYYGWVTVRSLSVNLLTVNGTSAGALVASSAVAGQAATKVAAELPDGGVQSIAGNGGGSPALALASISV